MEKHEPDRMGRTAALFPSDNHSNSDRCMLWCKCSEFYPGCDPQWVTDGLSIAAGMLPVVGIGMLMRYMPVKKFLPFILIGFVLSAYLSMPVLGIAIVGFAAAFWYFTTEMKKAAEAEKAVAVTTVDEMGDDFDE